LLDKKAVAGSPSVRRIHQSAAASVRLTSEHHDLLEQAA
jgi:hypothetical protein